MNAAIPNMFADVTSKLEDLHAVAVEGQRADNAPDMQSVLNIYLRDGLAALDDTMLALTKALESGLS
jgi:hypothetical protein